jgi:hypothetical protein
MSSHERRRFYGWRHLHVLAALWLVIAHHGTVDSAARPVPYRNVGGAIPAPLTAHAGDPERGRRIEVFRVDWHPATAANPYLAFYAVARESGRLRFEWIDDGGTVYATEAEITVV